MKPILVLLLTLAAASGAYAEDFVFETRDARLVIRSDGSAGSLTAKGDGRDLLRSGGRPFAVVVAGGQLFRASAVDRRGGLFHVTFGASGVDADYRIVARTDYILAELAAFHGEGVEEIRFLQLFAPLAKSGMPLAVLWDNEFAVSLIGLSPEVDSEVVGRGVRASVYPKLSMSGSQVALVAVPTKRFLDVVRTVESDFHLPSPLLGGTWAKRSEDVRTSYLFTDLTEANADETIRYAKLAGFRYILVYNWAWSESLGSYPINTRNFPHGDEGLKRVIDKCHAAGLKVGMHMLTSFVGINDPLVTPKPNPGLFKDSEATLAADVNEKATEIVLSQPAKFPIERGPYGPAREIQIDDEIIRYAQVNGGSIAECVRGFAGTKPAPHKSGAKIYHLAEFEGSYLTDLRTPLKDVIADRVAELINRCGFDMIYFDGGEVNAANGPAWYWLGVQQTRIWEKSKRELLIQGSGITGWTWHFFSRGACDDYAEVATKQYLDYHKIADYWKSYNDDFLSAELGWIGFLTAGPDHPATTPDEVEYYAVRALALDSGLSFETVFDELKANGRTNEIFKLLGDYERLRLGGAVPKAMRDKLAAGEWHMTKPGEFHPIRYDAEPVAVPSKITLTNQFTAQSLKFRLRAAPTLAPPGDSANVSLIRPDKPIDLSPPDPAKLPGSLIQHYGFPKPFDLSKHRALAVRIDVDGDTGPGESAVLNVQIEAGGFFRDYYVDLKSAGSRTVILAEPGTARMLAEFRPLQANYAFKSAMYSFDYGSVEGLNLRWMRYPKGSTIRCRVSLVEALQERDNTLKNVEIWAGSSSIVIPGEMKTGDYAEYWGDGTARVFDRNGVTLSTFPVHAGPRIAAGANQLALKSSGSGTAVFTAITLGN